MSCFELQPLDEELPLLCGPRIKILLRPASIVIIVARIRRLADALDTTTEISCKILRLHMGSESFRLIRRKVRSGKAQAPTEIYRLVDL